MAKNGTMSGQLDIWSALGQAYLWSDIPPWKRHLVVKSSTKLGPVDLCSFSVVFSFQ